MRFPFFASFIVFCIWLGYELHKRRNIDSKNYEAFWDRERKANSTRRKSLDSLKYIRIPMENFPFGLLGEDETAMEYEQTIRDLSEEPIVNLTGYSNTDLKLAYGAPNIDLLSLYDQRYTTLVCTLQDWSELLYKKGFPKEAKTLLEFSVETRTDVYASYELLIRIYEENAETDRIPALLSSAQEIRSLSKSRIVRLIEEHSNPESSFTCH